jgi:hypothetical protein
MRLAVALVRLFVRVNVLVHEGRQPLDVLLRERAGTKIHDILRDQMDS